MGDHQPSKNSGTSPEVVREMMPFAIYAIIPIAITIAIAYYFGSTVGY